MTEPRRIGFRTSHDDKIEPIQQINTTEEEITEESPYVNLEDYIPGGVYDGNGNIVTQESFKAKIKKIKAEARNLNWSALAKLILYSGLSASVVLLSYGAYKKYFDMKNNINKAKTEIVSSKER